MKKMILWAAMTLMTMSYAQASDKANNDNVITKEFKLSGFSGIKNNHAVTVHYTQGNNFYIKAEGSEKQIERLSLEVKDGVLVVSDKQKDKKNNIEKQTLTLYITSPDMNCLENKGVLNFDTDNLKTGNFTLNSNGVLHLEISQLNCSEAAFNLKGVSSLDMQIDAKALDFNSSGVSKGEMKVKADKLDIASNGVDSMEFDFNGQEVKVKKSGTGTINLQVDCQKLDASNSGVGKLVISGTADETSIQNSGITKIDVSKLNKF
ncbi:MAG: DUF2807 domain-containing protein [Bacteroidaceae bacterium]|nr:DUF2807 domain-containing protein [Bacteroidaceae bacterium]